MKDTLRLTVTPASGPQVHFEGTYEIGGIDLMRVTPLGVSWYWAIDMDFSGNNLKLTNGAGAWDFNQDGQPEPAKWNLLSTRQAGRDRGPGILPSLTTPRRTA